MSIENVSSYDLNSKLFENRKAEADNNFQKVVEKKSQKKDNKDNVIQTEDKYVPSKKDQPVEKADKEVKEELKTKPASEVFTGGSKEVNIGVDTFKKSASAESNRKVESSASSQGDEDEAPSAEVQNSLGNLQSLLLNYAQPENTNNNPETK